MAAKSGPWAPLALISCRLFKYAYVLFDHVVRGVDEPPALDINMANPLSEQRHRPDHHSGSRCRYRKWRP